ncbi:nuclear transport factor 2 family protein [Telluribacter sp. SYSU D00476]|uniref:nuclear transport factor 2 family protein n=1 Tax=Telluribacter sp. SYSU D00476 TaxID=2811430 RepID=UPI001FF43D4F|nr:nuclear transport factor 2 family protein [Telluribacter sp. SYSU D00476]
MNKIVLLSLLAFMSLVSCNQEKQQDIQSEAVGTGAGAKNSEVVNKLYEYFNRHEWDRMASLYAETAEFKDPSLGTGTVKQTREQTIQKYSEMSKMFPDIADKVVSVYPTNGKEVIVEFISTGTAPDGSKFELPICTIFTIEDGLITKDYTYYDNF